MPQILDKPAASAAPAARFNISSGVRKRPQRVVLYGPGGVGKTTLAGLAPGGLFFDLEPGSDYLPVKRIDPPSPWDLETLRAAVQSMPDAQTYVLDSATKAEELAIAWTLANVPKEKGGGAKNVEDYGFGKGYQHVYDSFLPLLGDLDRAIEAGHHVVLIAHECTADCPNPAGDDFIRYEPRLQAPKSGRASIRDRVFEWADWVGYMGFDVLAKDGKGRGNGTRTVYFEQRPTWRAKGRGAAATTYAWNDKNDRTIWKEILA